MKSVNSHTERGVPILRCEASGRVAPHGCADWGLHLFEYQATHFHLCYRHLVVARLERQKAEIMGDLFADLYRYTPVALEEDSFVAQTEYALGMRT